MSNKTLTAWDRISIARSNTRPTALEYIENIFDDFIELHGDRCFRDDKAIVCGIATLKGKSYTIIAEQKGKNTKENIIRNFGMPNPESYRKAIRFMKQAEKFKRPVITFIDTKGAYPGIGAEERGQGEAIAKSMMTMANLKVPIISIVIGEGSSGGALAIGVADKILMLENAVYSILSPEGYASILWKDGTKAKEAAQIMKMTADDLYDLKVIDKVIKELEEDTIEQISQKIQKEILSNIKKLEKLNIQDLLQNRYDKFRNMGEYINIK